jgi:hypothetical protein
MTVSDAPSCGITHNCYSGNSRGVIYDRNIFIIQARGATTFNTKALGIMTPRIIVISNKTLSKNETEHSNTQQALLYTGCHSNECSYADSRYSKCCYAECHCAECPNVEIDNLSLEFLFFGSNVTTHPKCQK